MKLTIHEPNPSTLHYCQIDHYVPFIDVDDDICMKIPTSDRLETEVIYFSRDLGVNAVPLDWYTDAEDRHYQLFTGKLTLDFGP